MMANKDPAVVAAIEKLMADFKVFQDTNPSETDLKMAEKQLWINIDKFEASHKQISNPSKAASIYDRVMADRGIAAMLKDKACPLEVMYEIMNHQLEDDAPAALKVAHNEHKLKAAIAAAPYVHKRAPAAVEVTGKDGGAIEVEHTNVIEKIMSVLFQDGDIIEGDIIEDNDDE